MYINLHSCFPFTGVFWEGNDYPGSSEINTCEVNKCRTMSDGSCLCKTTVTDSVVFTDMSVTKEDVMSQLFIGSLGPQDGSHNATNITDGLTAHTVGGVVDDQTIFEVRDKGRTMYLKNIVSMVSLEGWELMTPKIYEAEDATIHNTVSSFYLCNILILRHLVPYPLTNDCAYTFLCLLYPLICAAKLGRSEEQY